MAKAKASRVPTRDSEGVGDDLVLGPLPGVLAWRAPKALNILTCAGNPSKKKKKGICVVHKSFKSLDMEGKN